MQINSAPEAAQYAIDNLEVDYKENALKSAKNYSDMMHMSKQGLYNQLISEYGRVITGRRSTIRSR